MKTTFPPENTYTYMQHAFGSFACCDFDRESDFFPVQHVITVMVPQIIPCSVFENARF